MMGLLKMPWTSQHPHEGLDRHLLDAMAPPAASVAPDTNAARPSHLHFAPEIPYAAGNRRAYTAGDYQETPYKPRTKFFSKPGSMFKVLFRWRSSIWRATFTELAIYLTLYTMLSLNYRFVLTEPRRRDFERFSLFVTWHLKNILIIPLGLVLGFYVSSVYNRWWAMWNTLPWPDRFMIIGSAAIKGDDEDGILIRRTLNRYLNLTFAMTAIGCGSRMRNLYPTLQHLIDDGLLTHTEMRIIEKCQSNMRHKSSWWLALTWTSNLLFRAFEQGRIQNDRTLKLLMEELLNYRQACAHMFDFAMVGVPVIYTQVVALSVYSFLGCTLVGFAQYLDPSQNIEGNTVDIYVPVFSMTLFVVLVGWMKVAGKMIKPYNDTDDDFLMDTVWVLHRNVEVGNMMIDDESNFFPPLELTTPLTGAPVSGPKFFDQSGKFTGMAVNYGLGATPVFAGQDRAGGLSPATEAALLTPRKAWVI
mmetsp:Transcript_1127/g.2003  ORF Transcript_1127/g.2003 Transcript_1127/m.2003 type:complete len:473 (+) Transcript_1127:188-1606(+)